MRTKTVNELQKLAAQKVLRTIVSEIVTKNLLSFLDFGVQQFQLSEILP